MSEQPQLLLCEVSFQGTDSSFRLPLRGLWMGLGCPWPTAHFSWFPNEVGIKVNVFGRRGLWWGSCSETGQWLLLGRGPLAKWLRGLSSLSVLLWRGERSIWEAQMLQSLHSFICWDKTRVGRLLLKKTLARNSDPPPCPTFKTRKQDLQEQTV